MTSRAKHLFKNVDRKLLWLIVALVTIGFLILASASIALSEREHGHPYYYLIRQAALGLGLGGILFYTALKIPMQQWKKYAPLLFMVSIILLVLVLIPPFGQKINGARRWIHIGSLSFQPSEFTKIAFILYLSAWMSGRKKELTSFTRGFLPFAILTGVVCLLIMLQPNLSTTAIIATIGLVMYFLGGGKVSHLAIGCISALLIFSLLVLSGYRRDRVMTFFNPGSDEHSTGYQIKQSLIAIGSGGFFGRGLGLSRQKFQYLPEPAGDAIFAIFAEEMGLLGSVLLLSVFFWLISRGMLAAARTKDFFSQLVALGIVTMVSLQVIINIAALSGLMPLTGIPLPFMSYGGTALAILLFEMGLLLQISRKHTP